MKNKITIDNPCEADFNKMDKVNGGAHCSICQTTVVDFTNKSLNEIQLYFQKQTGKKVCGVFHQRHTTKTNIWLEVINKVEFSLTKRSFGRMAFFLVYILLLVTGCKTKKHRTTGMPGSLSASNQNSAQVDLVAKR